MTVMMLVLQVTEVIGPERHHFEEDVPPGPADEHVTRTSGCTRFQLDTAPKVYADGGQARLGQRMYEPVRGQVTAGIAAERSEPANVRPGHGLEAGPPADGFDIPLRSLSRSPCQERRIAAQNRDGCAVRAGFYGAAEPAVAEELGQICDRLSGGLLAAVSQVVSAIHIAEPFIPPELPLAVSDCRQDVQVTGVLHHASMPDEQSPSSQVARQFPGSRSLSKLLAQDFCANIGS